MAQNPKRDVVTFLIGSTLWPQTRAATLSHSWLDKLGPNRDQKLFQNSNKVKKLFKTVKIENATVSHSVLGQLYGPEYTLQNADNVKPYQKKAFFSAGVTWQGHWFNLIRYLVELVKESVTLFFLKHCNRQWLDRSQPGYARICRRKWSANHSSVRNG